MEKTCYFQSCSSALSFFCTTDSTFLCEEHMGSHQKLNGPHNYISIKTSVNPDSFSCVLSTLQEFYSYSCLLRSKVISESKLLVSEILKVSNQFCSQLTLFESHLRSTIEVLVNKQPTTSFMQDYIHSLCNLPLGLCEVDIKQKWGYPVITPNTRKLLPQLMNLFELQFLKYPLEVKESPYLYFFADDTPVMVSLHVVKENIQNWRLELKSNRGHAGSLCYLGDQKKIFYGGGFVKGKTIADYFILKEDDGTVQPIKGGRPRKQGGCCLDSHYIYLFGGCEGDRAMKFSDKFNLETSLWETVSNLPSPSDTTAVNFDGKILIAGGLLTSIYYFDPVSQTYVECSGNFGQGNKFICAGNGKAYMFHEGYLYSSEIWNPWKWMMVKETTKLGKYWIAASIRHKNFIYFTTGHYSFFKDDWPKARRFNLDTLELTEII